MASAFDNLNTIADVARLGIYEALLKELGPLGYQIEFSNINVRVYIAGTIICKIFIYPNKHYAEIAEYRASLTLSSVESALNDEVKYKFDDPRFFEKIVDAVKIIAHL